MLPDSIGNTIVECQLLIVNQILKVLEHFAHLLRKLLQVLIRLGLSLSELHFIESHILFKLIDLMQTTADRILLSCISIHGGCIDSKHTSNILKLIVAELLAFLSAALLELEIFRNTFLAHGSIEMVENGFREMNLTKIVSYLRVAKSFYRASNLC